MFLVDPYCKFVLIDKKDKKYICLACNRTFCNTHNLIMPFNRVCQASKWRRISFRFFLVRIVALLFIPKKIGCINAKKESKLPPWYMLGIHFSVALYRHIRNGMKKTRWRKKRDRYKTCLRCPGEYLISSGLGKHCKLCGCPVKDKVAWDSERCPAKFWPEQKQEKKVTA